jgi:hypothetical protein
MLGVTCVDCKTTTTRLPANLQKLLFSTIHKKCSLLNNLTSSAQLDEIDQIIAEKRISNQAASQHNNNNWRDERVASLAGILMKYNETMLQNGGKRPSQN